MNDLQRIEKFFSPERLIDICEDEFRPLAEQIAFNMMTKTSNSGADVNSLGLPEETTGATAESLRTTVESTNNGLIVSFVGRKGIKSIDEGSSPSEIQQEFGSFDDFLKTIEKWARDKESRWFVDPGEINAYSTASHLWDRGTKLYQEGGGTEIMKDLLPQVIEKISAKLTEELDTAVYEWLNTSIDL